MSSGDKFMLRILNMVCVLLQSKRSKIKPEEKKEVEEDIIKILKTVKILNDILEHDRVPIDFNIF
jgi:hypothetical protein